MEQPIERVNNKLRRRRVAAFIHANLKPAQYLLEEGLLNDFDEEIGEEAQHFEVRDYQLDAWGALWDARLEGAKKALIHLATGLGKTSVAVFDVIKFREEIILQFGREPRVLFACGKNEILEQASERFAAFMPQASQGIFNKRRKDSGRQITFATMQSLAANLSGFSRDEFDYIIYDEAHHTKANTFESVVEFFRPQFQLALTATPDRLDELNIRELFGTELYSKGLAQALAEGLLAAPDYHIVFDDAVRKAIESDFKPKTVKELNGLFDLEPRNEVIAQNIKEEMSRIGMEFGSVKTIAFCRDVAHAEEMAKLLEGESYHSGIESLRRRKSILNEFRYGNLQTICTRDMFNEGIDIPDARLLVFLRSTSSPTIFEQQLGRGLRKHAEKERVSVLDFVANVERIDMIRNLANTISVFAHHQLISGSAVDHMDVRAGRGGRGENFMINTGHGDFDFEKLSIDLLKRYDYLQLTRSRELSKLSNDELVALALEVKPEGPLLQDEIHELSSIGQFVSVSNIVKRFGGIIAFQRACGFEIRDTTELSNDEVIAMALKLKPEGALSNPEIVQLSKEGLFVSPSNIVKRFGGIIAFQRACGFEVRSSKDLSNDEVIAMALRLKSDGPMTVDEISLFSKQKKLISVSSITNRFGSIVAFQRACGFEVRDPLTREEVLATALNIKADGPLSEDDVNVLSKEGKFVSTRFIRDHFGSLREFQRACGFDIPSLPSELSDQQIIERALVLKPLGYLEQREITELSKKGQLISVASVVKRFGSLRAFQEACMSAQQQKETKI